MEQPRPRIIRRESHHQPPSRRQHRRIATSRIIEVERRNSDVAELTIASAEDPEVVPVQVHRVREVDRDGRAGHFLDDPVVPLQNISIEWSI